MEKRLWGWFLIAAACWFAFAFTADMWRIDSSLLPRALDAIVNASVAACICASIYRDRIAK